MQFKAWKQINGGAIDAVKEIGALFATAVEDIPEDTLGRDEVLDLLEAAEGKMKAAQVLSYRVLKVYHQGCAAGAAEAKKKR